VEESINHNEPVKKKNKRRWWLKIIYFLVALFVIVDLFLFFFATPILKTYLQGKIHEQTEGLFTVDFEKISIELGTRRLALEKFELTSDTSVYNQLVEEKKIKAALYNISCHSIELWGTSVYNLLLKSKLKARELKLIDPIIELKKLPKQDSIQKESRDFVHEDLFPATSKYFNEIQIKQIMLENGKFLLNLNKDSITNSTHIGYVSVDLYDFLLNEEQYLKKEKLFYSNDLQIHLTDYKISLSDKVHFVYADSINISTKSSKLTAKNVGMSPLNESNQFLNSINSNFFKLIAPIIELQNFNIHELYFKNDIKIGQLAINTPTIKVVNKLKRAKRKKASYNQTMEIDLSRLIAGKLNSITVDTFKVTNGILNFYYQNWQKPPTYKANNFSLDLISFDLYENANNNAAKILYSDSLKLVIDTFNARLPDKIHSLNAKSIYISSGNKVIEALGLSLKPLRKKSSHNSLNINIPKLKITGTDFLQLYHKRALSIAGLYISPSKFKLKLWQKQKDDSDSTEKKNPLSTLTTNFVKHLYIRTFKLNKSRFEIDLMKNDSVSYAYQGEAVFQLNRFLINASSFNTKKNNLFYADQFKLKLNNYQQDLRDETHVLKAKSIEASNIDSVVEIANFRVYPKNENNKLKLITKNRSYKIDLIQAYIRGIDINKAYSDSSLIANSISVLRPNVNIFNNYTSSKTQSDGLRTYSKKKRTKTDSINTSTFRNILAAYFKQINVRALNIENANVKIADIDSLGKRDIIMSGKLSARLNKFYFNPKAQAINEQISYSDNISFRITDYFGKFFNKNYQLKFKRAQFSSRDSLLTARIVRLFPTKTHENSNQSSQLFTFYAPTIESKNVNFSELLDFNILSLGKLTIKNPSLALTQKKNKTQAIKPLKTKKDSIKKAMKIARIKFDEIIIKDGVFGILNEDFNFEKLTSNAKIDLSIKNLDIDTFALSNPKTLFSNLDATIKLSDTHFQLPDSMHFIDLERLELNTLKKEIHAKNFEFKTINRTSTKNSGISLQEFIIPELAFSGFDFGELITDKKLISNELFLNQPQINLFNQKSNAPRKPIKFSELNLYNKIKKGLKLLNISKIKSDNTKINLSTREGFNTTHSEYDEIFANITGLLIDSLHQNDGRLLNADDITINMKNYNFDFSDSLYRLTLKNFGFSTGKRSIFAKSILLNPNFGRYEYAEKIKKEFSLSYLKSGKLEAQNVDFHKLFDNREFIADKIDMDKIQFHAYKYKQYPLDSVQKIALPLDYIWKAKNLIKIDTLRISDSYIGHDILGKNALEDGFLDFTRVNVEMLNLTNDPKAIERDEETVIKASGYLMNEALLTSSFHFPIASKYGEYIYGGRLDTFDMSSMNPLLENLLFVSIQDGTINSLDFSVVTNEDYSTGKLVMLYDDLKLGLISKKKSDSLVVEKRGLFSMVANSFVRDKNPRRKSIGPKKGRVYFERNQYKSIFNYWTFSLLSGMRATLGFKSKQLKERLKIEKDSSKFNKRYTKKNYRLTKKSNKVYEKQIQQELKDEQKNRKKQEKKEKKDKRKNKKSVASVVFLKPENNLVVISRAKL